MAVLPGQKPEPTPEGELIRRAMVRKQVNAPDVAESAGITPGRWRHIVNGAQPLGGGQYHPVVAPAVTLARMARAVGVTPEELAEVGRNDAAEVLRDLVQDEAETSDRYVDPETGKEYVDPDERALWALTHIDEQDRRELIAYLRTRREMNVRTERRRAG